jgi:7-cyano-7-deazaguanine tRNA-ribosyltransferase
MRASDGLFTLKLEGGKRLHHGFEPTRLRVVIKDDAVPFIKEGKSVFAKFVEDCDEEIRPLDEVLIVDKNDEFIAIGRALLNKEEMLAFDKGVAVKVREEVEEKGEEET